MQGEKEACVFDVVIVGAGLSGIGAAYHLQQQSPQKTYAILEGRAALGGTWDLFRYPGIRSDSSMHTLGYGFKPWTEAKAIADGPAILKYVRETAVENGIDRHIRYGHKVKRATWCSDEMMWTLEMVSAEKAPIKCRFICMCAGYYSYDKGYTPHFAGRDRFQGPIIHPQQWPENLDYQGKRIVVIGSGATAVTLVPELAKDADHVVMLQRSPTYMFIAPDEDRIANTLRRLLPESIAYRITRWINVALGQYFYRQSRNKPAKIRQQMLDAVRAELPEGYDVEKHFGPAYDPWDQRVCLVPNSDLFVAIREGSASVVTDHIDTFTESGILLKSGQALDADVIVTATGLNLKVMGGIEFVIDDEAVNFANTVTYKGLMFSDVPNIVSTFGYINASWTLRADLTADYMCRLINYMDENGFRSCTPRWKSADAALGTQPGIANFTSGYIQRSLHMLPKQGLREPWINPQDYKRDKQMIVKAPIDDGRLEFKR